MRQRNCKYFIALYNQDDECVAVFDNMYEMQEKLNYKNLPDLYHRVANGKKIEFNHHRCKPYKFERE